MKTSILTLSAAAILCAACVNEITPNFDDMNGELVINALLFTDHDTNYVYVSETAPSSPPPVNNATVEMRVNGVLVETVDKVTPTVERTFQINDGRVADSTTIVTNNGVYRLTKRFNEGDVVRIDVYANGHHAWAEDIAPRSIQNPTADYKVVNRYTYQFGDYTELSFVDYTIHLPDISQEPEYYRISLYADYGYSEAEWTNYWLFFYDEETDNLDSIYMHSNIDSICNELRGKYKMVVPVDYTDEEGNQKVDIFYLRNGRTTNWNYGTALNYDYGDDPILSEGEMSKTVDDGSKDQEILLTNIPNKHKVFTDNYFSNSTAEIHISTELDFGNILSPEEIYARSWLKNLPEEYLLMGGMTYNYKVKLSIESISENQYYYLKALNVIESESYADMSQLSGALKIPSNVNGGGGNICITTNSVVEFNILDNYTRKRVVVEEPKYY